MPRRLLPLIALLAALAAPPAAHASFPVFAVHGSTGQAYVQFVDRGDVLRLVDRRGRTVATRRADLLGSVIFRDVKPGAGYRVVRAARGPRREMRSPAIRVLRAGENPRASWYRRLPRLKAGLNYVQMRDGITLAATVRLPAGKTLADGPFPTLIEYSGYQTAAPHDLFASVAAQLGGAAPDPLAPASSTAVGSLIAPLLGYAVVSVQMRGSGCSGGAFGLFDLPTTYDGYDIVEKVAAQPWVKGGKVGMVGISFSGISQLFVAGTRPPHLAAIAPLSVTDDLYAGTSFPGGIRNSGFATEWLRERMDDAQPAPQGGQPYARALVKAGDENCQVNQRLRLQTQDAPALLRRFPFREPSLYGDRSPDAWMSKIEVPVFLAGQFQDEQTSGHFAEALGRLRANRKVWIVLQNGTHADSLGPDVITRWAEFNGLYVADQIPVVSPTVLSLSGVLYGYLAGAGAKPVAQTRFAGTTDVAAARAAFERDPRVRVVMDNGAGAAGLGSIGGTWELGFDSWPVRQAVATAYHLDAGGALTTGTPYARDTVSYVAAPAARPAKTLPGKGDTDAWKAQPPYTWAPLAAGKGVGFTTAPLEQDLVIAGSSSLDLQLRSTARDTDLQVTLSEVRPDGQETYVQNGWLRASHRRLDTRRSTSLDPVPTHLAGDAAPLPAGRFTLVRVPILPVVHAFRAGSRLRVTIQAPGGDRPRWSFASIDRGRTTNTIQIGAGGSQLVLPVVPGASAQGTPLPAPTALRGEPTRAYAPASNGG